MIQVKKILLVFFLLINVFALCTNNQKPITEINPKVNTWMEEHYSLGFEENKGQVADFEGNLAPYVFFKASLPNMNIWITDKGITYQFLELKEEEKKLGELENSEKYEKQEGEWQRVDMVLKDAQILKENILKEGDISQGVANYFLAHCKDGVLDVKTYSKITIKNIYKGIDWVLYTSNAFNGNSLKQDFIVHPYADPNQIKLIYEGSGNFNIVDNQIQFENEIGKIHEGQLLCYQDNESNVINSQYSAKSNNALLRMGAGFKKKMRYDETINFSHFSYEIGIELEQYDKSKTLVIDPQLVWASFYGGNVNDGAYGIDTDTNGDVYVTGYSNSTNYPISAGAYQGTLASANLLDIICIKFNSVGQRQWATYFGGNQNDEGRSICINAGTVFIFGYSDSNTIPTINSGGYFQAASTGGRDAFILSLSSAGTPSWATFFGGSGYEWGAHIYKGANSSIFVTGETQSNDFPQVDPGGGAYAQGFKSGSADMFVAKFNNVNALVWSTYVGGNFSDAGTAVCTDPTGNVYVTGYAGSTSFFPFQNPGGGAYYQTTVAQSEAVILKFSNNGNLLWSTYCGGSAADQGISMRCDKFGNLFLLGTTSSLDFPVFNPGGGAYFQTTHAGGNSADAFIMKFNSAGVRQWGTFYGGTNPEGSVSTDNLEIDTCSNVYVIFGTGSVNIPTYGAGGCAAAYYDATHNGGDDSFIVKFSNKGVRLWATYFGGPGTELSQVLAIDNQNSLYTSGEWILAPSQNESTYPITPYGSAYYDATKNGSDDSHIAKFVSASTSFTQTQTNNTGCSGCNGTATINIACGNGTYSYSWSNGVVIVDTNSSTSTITNLCAGTYTVNATNVCGQPVTATFTITSSGGAPVTSSQTFNICPGDSTALPDGSFVSSPGTYTDTLLSGNGCDSIITTTVSLNPPITISANKQICPGQSVSLPGGGVVSSPGVYKDTLTAANGCDSIITTTVTQVAAITTSQTPSICNGNNFTLPDGSIVNTSGTYIDTIVTTAGCDSIITTTLTVLSNSSFAQNQNICNGNSYTLPGGTVVSVAGIYTDTILSFNGCDSVITTNLAVLPNDSSSQNLSICNGTNFTLPGGAIVSTSGTYIDTVAATNGCDSIVTTNLSVVNAVTFTQNPKICIGNSFTLPGGTIVTTTGVYTDTVTASGGCDSIVTTNLSVVNAILDSISSSICVGNNYTLPGGAIVNTSGIYNDTLLSIGGCDSIITTNLIVHNTSTFSQSISICLGQNYTLPGGAVVSTSGTYVDTILSSTGCDSVVTTNLSAVQAIQTSQSPVLCVGGSFTLPGGTVVTTPGTYIDTLTASGGCDSIVTTNLAITPNATSSQSSSFCIGGSFVLPSGVVVTTSGTYYDTLISAAGCDSIITSVVTVYPSPVISISPDVTIIVNQSTILTASGGGTYIWSPLIGLDSTYGTTGSSVVASPKQTTTYCVEVTSPNGCIDTSCVTVYIHYPCPNEDGGSQLQVPNAFSPNTDGINDEFCLQGWDACLESFNIVIFDRWGEKLFESADPNFCWDGQFRNTLMDSQVLVYYIKARFTNIEKPVIKKGNISLIR